MLMPAHGGDARNPNLARRVATPPVPPGPNALQTGTVVGTMVRLPKLAPATRPAPKPGAVARLRQAVAPAKPSRTAQAWSFMRAHKAITAVSMALILASTAVLASVLINQSVSTAPSTKAPDVTFLAGDDLVAIEALGFLDVTIGTSATSVQFGILGIAGATDVTMTDVLELNNGHATTDYTVTLVRSAALDSDINLFEVTLRGVAGGDVTWDILNDGDGRSPSFTLEDDGTAGDQLEIDFAIGIVDGIANGANLDDFDLTFELVPV